MNYDNNPSFLDAKTGLDFWTGIAIAMAVIAELMQTLLVGHPASVGFLPPRADWLDWMNFIGSFAGVPAGVLWLGGKTPPIRIVWSQISLVIGTGICAYLMAFNNSEGLHTPVTVFCVALAPLGIFWILFGLFEKVFRNRLRNGEWSSFYLRIAVLLAALSVATNAGLADNRLVFPATWDYYVYRIDDAFWGTAAKLASLNESGIPFVQAFSLTSYSILVIATYTIAGLAVRKESVAQFNIWRFMVLPYAIAFLLYAFLPLSGPAYTFFDGSFPDNLPLPSEVIASQVIVPPAYRNAMPSMHLTGALLVWMLSIGLRHRIAILFSTVLVFATVWSTMARGEHYLLDLVVALPYSAFLGIALIWPKHLRAGWKTAGPIWLAATSFVIWMLLLKVVPQWLSLNPWFVRLFSVWSLVCACTVAWCLVLNTRNTTNLREMVPPKVEISQFAAKAPRWIIGTFTASGIAGLVYEVVYAKALAVTFGSTALASYTVLATYMGGMALGAWLGGHIADRSRNPLVTYAFCEALIGLYAALTPMLFRLVQNVYVSFSLDTPPDAGWLTVLRLFLGVGCLGLPTILMGATMPLMFKHLRGLGVSSRGAIAPLYGANVAGAAIGSVIAGYWILPAVGRNGGTYLAAAMSLVVALYVLDRSKRMDLGSLEGTAQPSEDISSSSGTLVDARLGVTALVILFVGGAVTLGLEVNSMHLLAVVAGNSVYAFALMLATFLAGLGLGSQVGEPLMERFSRIDLVAWSQCGVAFAIGITAQTWDNIPAYFSSFSIYPITLTFAARETIRAMVCAVAMLPAAFFIGMSYPAAMSLASDWLSPKGGARGLGLASGLNTLGNIIGVVLIGFWLLPSFGSRNSSLFLALIALGLGVLALMVKKGQTAVGNEIHIYKYLRWFPLLAAISALWAFPSEWNQDDLATGSNVYFASQNWGKVVDHAESVEGGLTSVAKNPEGVSTLLTNGKFQGNDASGGEMVAQESFALFPLLHTAQRNAALVIGYGTGMTAHVLHESGFKQIEVAELSKDIVMLANRHFGSINHLVTDQPGVLMHYTDGRNFLLTQSRKFDLISIEISSIWFAGAANCYNRDFYALARKRLSETGVLQQWVQLHHIAPIDLAYVIGSVRSEFKYVWLYVRGGQGIIVASNSPESIKLPGEALVTNESRTPDDGRQPEQLRSHLLLSPDGVNRFISSLDPSMNFIVSTDINLYLEHSTPKGNALGNVLPANLRLLSSFETAVEKQ